MAEITREATAKEQKLITGFVDRVIAARDQVKRTISAGGAAKQCQDWIDANAIAYPKTLWTSEDTAAMKLFATRATNLETYAAGLTSRTYYARPDSTVSDFAIVIAKADESQPVWAGLGIVPLIIVVAGVVLLAAAVTTAIGFYSDAKKSEEETKKKVAELDAWALKQGGTTASKWKDFKATNAKANPTFWDSMSSAISSWAPWIGLGLLAWFFFSRSRSSSSSRSSSGEAAS